MVVVYILTHNRPETLIKTLHSVLSQSYRNFKIIVSDNSSNNDTQCVIEELLKSRKDDFAYIRRIPVLSPIEHFNTILSEVDAELFMLFHDDDIMHPDMLTQLTAIIESDKSIAAVGSNAVKIRNNKASGYFRKANHNLLTYSNRSEFISTYLGAEGCAPFPSYLYRSSLLGNTKMNFAKGGKYCDVSFLMSVSDNGPVVITNKPLMDYYIHEGQDSSSDVFLDRSQLIKEIVSTTQYSRHSPEMKSYRLYNIFGEIKQRLRIGSYISLQKYFFLIILALKYSRNYVLPRVVYYLPSLLKKKI